MKRAVVLLCLTAAAMALSSGPVEDLVDTELESLLSEPMAVVASGDLGENKGLLVTTATPKSRG